MRAAVRLARPVSVIAALLLLVAACGGAASPSPAATAAGSPSPATSPSAAASAPASESTAPSGPDISGAAEAIRNLTGYQLDVAMQGAIPGASGAETVTVKAVIDRKNKSYEFTIAGMTGVPASGLKVIVIGNDAWVDLGTGSYIKQPGGAASFGSSLDAFEPATLLQSIPSAAMSAASRVGDEQKNGVATTHYHMDAANTPDLATSLGAAGVVDLWIATDGGYLVSMKADGETTHDSTTVPLHMTMDISRLNDPTINIVAPN